MILLLNWWQRIRDNAQAAIKAIKKQRPAKPAPVREDPPTPAQLYATWQAAVADVSTAESNVNTAAANVVDAESTFATALFNLETANENERACQAAWALSVTPGGSE